MAQTPYLGAIFIFAGNFAPRGYQLCQGQLLPIQQYTAVFSLLGTTYGGNGVSTFALPDLRGRAPIGSGNGQGLSPVILGEIAGAEHVSILTSNLPAHNHLVGCDSGGAANTDPTNGIPGNPGLGQQAIYSAGPSTAAMLPTMVSVTGSGIPIGIQNPYLGINYIIAMEGIFPSRS
ncbi:MAG TPA: tail fiber protein [Bryobacteraceae bacterium]|jgi:microcystin-dependent protein|nr:tail fiber protein [Bryobacteraceae bacterium]